jgi:tRNA threonylcarbamoyladenosine biosynthesis protein TsaB
MTGEGSQPVVLALDSAGSACSVAVAVGETVLCAERIASVHGQAERLLPMVDAAIRKAALPPAGLDLVATTVGPGGFTGIRVGLAAAHGIALATGAQLIGVTSFKAVVAGFPPTDRERDWCLLVTLESRREDFYFQLFDRAGEPLGDPGAVMPAVLVETVSGTIGAAPLLIAGDAARRAALVLSERPHTTVLENSSPDAVGVLRVALRRWLLREPGDAPRPLYLRPPDVTRPSRFQSASLRRL